MILVYESISYLLSVIILPFTFETWRYMFCFAFSLLYGMSSNTVVLFNFPRYQVVLVSLKNNITSADYLPIHCSGLIAAIAS